MRSPDVLVCDASALLEILLRTSLGASIDADVRIRDQRLHVPSVCDVELVSGLRRLIRGKAITSERAEEVLEDYLDLSIERHGHRRFLKRIFELKNNFSAADAAYVSLTEWLGADLITTDTKLARAAREHLGINVVPQH